MNVLLLTKENNGGGLVTHVINLANTLKQKGHNVYVIGPLINGEKERFDAIECDFYPLDLSTKNPREFRKNMRIIKTLVRDKSIDMIHSHNRVASVYAQLVSKQTGVSFVWTLHLNNIPANPISRAFTFYGKKAIVVSSDIISFCEVKLKIPRKDIVVGYNGVFEEKYRLYSEDEKKKVREQYRIKAGQKVIVVLSRLDPVKGHKTVISAIEKADVDCVALFTGESFTPGYKEKLQEIVKQKRLENKVKFVGYVNPVEVLNISDLFVLPSVNEGFSISMIEAFLLRVPVIRTRTGGYEDVKDFVIPMEGEKDLAQYLKLFMDGKLDINEKVEKGYKFAIKNCTCNAMTDRVLGIYKEVLR